MGLAKQEGGKFRIRVGAFILFGKEDETVLLQRDFTFVKYDVEGKMYSYREDVSLSATRLLFRLMELIRPYNKTTIGVEGLVRQEKTFYPEAAIREALLNAFAHRDYRVSGLRNECRLYPNRMEIISAGALPGIITLENIDKRHFSRNPKIMHALLILGLSEELGQGIRLMKDSLKQNGNPPPDFIESTDQFKVVFLKGKSPRPIADCKRDLEKYFDSNEFITRAQIEVIAGMGKTSAKYFIQDLIKEGFLEKVGKGPGVKYRRKP